MRRHLAALLRWGPVLAALPVVIGAVLLIGSGTESIDWSLFVEGRGMTEPFAVLAGAMAGNGAHWVIIGVFVLVLLQLARALLTGLVFAGERDWTYAGLSLIVLVTLLVAFAASGLFGG